MTAAGDGTGMGRAEEDVRRYYRRAIEGHVYIRETLDAAIETLGRNIDRFDGRARILELGSHAGLVTETIVRRWPKASVTVCDEDEALVRLSRERLSDRAVQYHTRPLSTLVEPADLVLSVARHHHLPHDYLASLRGVTKPGAVYVLADELCPEYCEGEHARRIAEAEVIHVRGGYILTSHAEVAAFEASGAIPAGALAIERLRQRALWRWYRFVVDQAVERGYFDIAASELQSARDDLVTGSEAEHKFGPRVVERQLALAGFRQLSKRCIGPMDDAERQSMFVYEFERG